MELGLGILGLGKNQAPRQTFGAQQVDCWVHEGITLVSLCSRLYRIDQTL